MLETFVSQIMRQVVLALAHLVERGIEHRDVKPENLLLYNIADASRNQQAPLIKLADFGWAAVVDRSGGPPPAIPPEGVGSLWYAPPELNPPVKGSEIVMDELQGGKSDMWSVGVITYLLLTGGCITGDRTPPADLAPRQDFIRQDGGSSGYIERLAAQLVSVASFSAMTSQAAWSDVLYLAFLYLDVDCDGQLGADDLSVHLPGGYRPRDVAQVLSMKAANFLTPNDFQEAVSSALAPSSFPQPAETSPRLAPVEMHQPERWGSRTGRSPASALRCQETMQERMQAIEEACRKLADDGFQEFLDLEGKLLLLVRAPEAAEYPAASGGRSFHTA
eukprot:Skav205236  [mRNA]  locus=scaffold1794:196515:207055:+ [translate_table: standard]